MSSAPIVLFEAVLFLFQLGSDEAPLESRGAWEATTPLQGTKLHQQSTLILTRHRKIPPQRIEQLRASAQPYLKTPLGSQVQVTWYGWRPMTWDSLPIIGRIPGMQNGLLATGHNMLGLSLAPVTGRLITELTQERATHINIDAFSPDRF